MMKSSEVEIVNYEHEQQDLQLNQFLRIPENNSGGKDIGKKEKKKIKKENSKRKKI